MAYTETQETKERTAMKPGDKKSRVANVVSISGGKDSQATALLAIKSGAENLRFVFADTGHETQITYDFVNKLSADLERLCGVGIDWVKADFTKKITEKRAALINHALDLDSGYAKNRRLKHYTAPVLERMIDNLKPTGNPFLDLCIWKGRFPGTRSRFCSEELKHVPLEAYHMSLVDEFDAVVSWQGVRRDESKERAALTEYDVEFGSWEPEPKGLLIYRPILDWSAEDCFALIKSFGLDYNPLYKMGMGRVGCMPCIHARKKEIREIKKRLPGEILRVKEWERMVSLASKRGDSTLMDARITANMLGTGKGSGDISHETHGIEAYADWSMTSRKRGQMDLISFIELDEPPTCSSIYGLCE